MAQQLQGTFDEALSFLTNPVTGLVAWTDLEALNEICHLMCGKSSLRDIAGTDLAIKVGATLSLIDHKYPTPDEIEGSWEDWLNAFLADDPQIEILLLEEAIFAHWAPAEARSDIDPSTITSATS